MDSFSGREMETVSDKMSVFPWSRSFTVRTKNPAAQGAFLSPLLT